MAHTPEQRDKHTLCGARKRSDGKPCRKFAGEGTDHFGIGRCKLHGGSTPTHRQGAIAQEAKRRAVKFGAPVQVHPLEALMQMLYLSYGHAAWLKSEIEATDDLGTFESRVLVNIYNDERDRCARVAKACLEANVEERQVRLAERYGEMIARLITGILEDLSLTPAQRQKRQEIVRKHLLALDGGAEAGLIEGTATRAKARG